MLDGGGKGSRAITRTQNYRSGLRSILYAQHYTYYAYLNILYFIRIIIIIIIIMNNAKRSYNIYDYSSSRHIYTLLTVIINNNITYIIIIVGRIISRNNILSRNILLLSLPLLNARDGKCRIFSHTTPDDRI